MSNISIVLIITLGVFIVAGVFYIIKDTKHVESSEDYQDHIC